MVERPHERILFSQLVHSPVICDGTVARLTRHEGITRVMDWEKNHVDTGARQAYDVHGAPSAQFRCREDTKAKQRVLNLAVNEQEDPYAFIVTSRSFPGKVDCHLWLIGRNRCRYRSISRCRRRHAGEQRRL
jgi:hypothetical protein